MVRAQKPKELFTASEVARFCQVDLKTIHNWSDRGEIRHFRTPGRHLRFRRSDVLDFLRKYGYPIPEVLAEGKPRITVLSVDTESSNTAKKTLTKQFDVMVSSEVFDAIISIGARPPDVVVLDKELAGCDVIELAAAIKGNDLTRNVRTVLYAKESDALKKQALDAGASAVVEKGETVTLRETLESLLGLDR